jgi:uncharacterized membrane protein YkvA (DUF1232 family)
MSWLIQKWKYWAREIKVDVYALYLAYKDPRVPLYARVFAACVVAYAFSPLDLIPDPIPVLGYLDDLILIPLGVILAVRMIPPIVLAESRDHARSVMQGSKPVNRIAAVVIIALWISLAILTVVIVVRIVGK